jgi:hypothetical protein
MKIFTALLEWFINLFGSKKTVTIQKETESIVTSHKEEERSKRNVTKIREGPSKVTDRPDGGISFKDFNGKKNCLWFLSIFLVGCSVNIPQEPEMKYVIERYPVYDVPERPWLDDISVEELAGVTASGRAKIKNNFDVLIKWGESLQVILTGYNKYAGGRNNTNTLYKKLD